MLMFVLSLVTNAVLLSASSVRTQKLLATTGDIRRHGIVLCRAVHLSQSRSRSQTSPRRRPRWSSCRISCSRLDGSFVLHPILRGPRRINVNLQSIADAAERLLVVAT